MHRKLQEITSDTTVYIPDDNTCHKWDFHLRAAKDKGENKKNYLGKQTLKVRKDTSNPSRAEFHKSASQKASKCVPNNTRVIHHRRGVQTRQKTNRSACRVVKCVHFISTTGEVFITVQRGSFSRDPLLGKKKKLLKMWICSAGCCAIPAARQRARGLSTLSWLTENNA